MSDIDEIPVESVTGSRPGVSTGDRLVVGLAALALLGGMAIAAGNLLGPMLSDPAAARSPGPSADPTDGISRTPRPTPTEPPLRELTLVPGEPPTASTDGYLPTYWVEALAELIVRSSPSDTASVMDRLAPGQVVLAQQLLDDADWFAIVDGAAGGFVRLVEGETSLARTAVLPEGPTRGAISSIAAGPTGFVAHGFRPSSTYDTSGVTLHSADGQRWTPDDPPIERAWGGWAAAWGPSGWLAVGSLDGGSGLFSPWVWESTDGAQWTPIGEMPTAGEGFVAGLVANDDGYLLALGSPRVNRGVLWFSPDGLTWYESAATGLTEMTGPYVGQGGTGLLAVPDGFLTWAATDFDGGPPEVAFSRTGRRWQAVPLDTGSIGLLQVTAASGRVLALGLDDAGRTRAWAGAISDGGFEMAPMPSSELAFEGAVVTSVASDGVRAYAFGYERDASAARAWWSDGSAWRWLPIPDGGFGTIPRVAAAGPSGVVVAGSRHSAVASSPILWHLGDDGRWTPEARPAVPGIADPPPAECPPRPTTAYELVAVDAGVALACFGDASLTVVAWSVPCEQCWGGELPSPRTPADWLRGYLPYLLLLPWEGMGDGGWWRQAALHPDLTWQESWTDTWVRVTGHYDDPAAAACGTAVEVGYEWWWEGPETDVLACRRTFVVTSVEVLGRNRR